MVIPFITSNNSLIEMVGINSTSLFSSDFDLSTDSPGLVFGAADSGFSISTSNTAVTITTVSFGN